MFVEKVIRGEPVVARRCGAVCASGEVRIFMCVLACLCECVGVCEGVCVYVCGKRRLLFVEKTTWGEPVVAGRCSAVCAWRQVRICIHTCVCIYIYIYIHVCFL